MKVKARKVGNFLRRPHNIILLVLLICLVYLVIVPLIYIFKDTLVVHTSEVNRVHEAAGSYTLYHWNKTFASGEVYSTFVIPLVNSPCKFPYVRCVFLLDRHCGGRNVCMAGHKDRYVL